MRRKLPFVVVLTLVVGAIVVMEVIRASELDMTPSYDHDAGVPLGASYLYAALPDMIGAEVRLQRHSPFATLRDTTIIGHTYFFLTTSFSPTEIVTARLVEFVERGNVAFIAAETFRGPMADSLGVRTRFARGPGATGLSDSTMYLAAPGLRRTGGYHFDDNVVTRTFSRVDTVSTTALGYADDNRLNYVRIDRGEGAFYVHLAPRAFSNYNLVAADGAAYATAALSYLPSQPMIWDGAHKPQRTAQGSSLRFIQETRPLAFAYYTLLVGALLFVAFRGKRRQRPIPIIRPPVNQTVGFARAVAGLWHERGEDAALVERRVRHLRDSLRLAFHDPDLELSEAGADEIARRLGMPEDDLAGLIRLIDRLRDRRKVSPKDLLELDRRLDEVRERL